MDADLELLKSTLNSLVVSSPSQMDMRTLMKDYRNMIGSDIPIAKHGYRDMPTFLKERCSDCFVLSGPLRNPVLTLVVKESLKHIDSFVQKQKSANINKWLGKRRSIPAAAIAPTPNNRNDTPKFRPTSNNNSSYVQRSEPVKKSVNNLPLTIKEKSQPIEISTNKVRNTAPSPSPPQRIQSREESDDISNKLAVQNFFKKRMPSECLDPDFWVTDKDSAKSQDDDSGRITSSSGGSSSRKLLREELSQEIRALVAEYPEGISSIDFTTLYRCRYGRDVPYQAWGCTSVLAAVRLAGGARVWRSPHAPDWTLLPEGAAAPSSLSPAHLPQFPPRSLTHSKEVIDPDDALPGMDFDPSVFPDDCIHYVESIAQESVSGLQPGDTVPVCVGEVYSPSHMWLLRLGPDHDVAMETIMDEMTQYYSSGEGRDRALCLGAARVGHYCAALFEQDWHRAVIVRVIDADTFKVRHIDYGTVARVSLYQLKPLLRRWCELPAQALRARLADVRTTARGTWPLPASLRLLDLVKEKRLVASVVTVHEEENAIDIILVDTSGEDDVVIGHQLVQSGHAVPALSPSSPRQTSEAHLFPRFEALEGGATPNLGELLQLARLGIDPAYVDTYRRHVPGPAHPLVLAGSEHSDSDRDSDALPDADSDTIPDETTKEQKLVELHSETEEKNEPQKDSSADSMPRKEPPQEIPQVYPSMPNLHFMGAAPPLPPPPYFPPYFVPRPMPIPFPPYGNFHDFPPPVPPFGPGPFPPYAHPPPPPVCPPPPPVCPPPPAPPGQGEGPLALRRIDVEVFRRLATVDTRTAASHMSDALSRAAAAAAAQSRADDVAVARVDAAVFTRLIELDGDMAVRHMQATLERAVPSSRLNPEAEEFRLVNSETQTEPPPANPAPSPAVSRSQLSLLGGIAPPPGFENYTPRI